MKSLVSLVLLSSLLLADSPKLNQKQQNIFDYKQQQAELDADILRDSWISSLYVGYDSSQGTSSFVPGDIFSNKITLSIEQDIFQSGGIYHTIIKSSALRGLNNTMITKEKTEMIANIYAYVIQLKKLDLNILKSEQLIENKNIEIAKNEISYGNGLLDISILDSNIIELNNLKNSVVELQNSKHDALLGLKRLSSQEYKDISLDGLKLVTKEEFLSSNSYVKTANYSEQVANKDLHLAISSVLPKVSLYGQYVNDETDNAFVAQSEYYTYGFKVMIPINYNAGKGYSKARVAQLLSKAQNIEAATFEEDFYENSKRKFELINVKIKNFQETVKRYENLLQRVKNLYASQLKTVDDITITQNSLKSSKIDVALLNLDKLLLLNELFKRSNHKY
jgi:outer membrane protein TolC